MKLYGIATKECHNNLKCNQDLVPFIFTDYEIAKEGCDENEEVVELIIFAREVNGNED